MEEFLAKGNKFRPAVSISSSGGFSMSSGMGHRYKFSEQGYKGVKLYYDREKSVIGLKPVSEDLEGMFKLNVRENNKGAFFSARSFLNAYDIDPIKYGGKYTPKLVEDKQYGKMFIISLLEQNDK